MRRIDLTNKRVGMLTAKEPSHTNAHGDVIWKGGLIWEYLY